MKIYEFKNIEEVQLDDLVDDTESTGVLLKAYARIIAPVGFGDGPSAGDDYSGSSPPACDNPGGFGGGGNPCLAPE